MQVQETCLEVPWTKTEEPLFTTRRVLAYLGAAVHADDYAGNDESFWLITMTADRYPIARQRLKTAHLVAARISCREIFEAALLAGAAAMVCARTVQRGSVQPGLADGRLLYDLVETSKHMNVLLIDYLITHVDGYLYYSYQEHRRRARE